MAIYKKNYYLDISPDSSDEIRDIVKKILKQNDCYGVLPTPIDEIIEQVKIKQIIDVEEIRESFLSSLTSNFRKVAKKAISKLRGVADLREKAIWIANTGKPKKDFFTKGHELGHQCIPWHNVDPAYLDNDQTLRSDFRDITEREASFFSSEIIFQGELFNEHVLSYAASIEAVFKIADEHQATYQTSFWRYVEEQDEEIAIAQYYPARISDIHGNPILKLWKIIGSPKYQKKYASLSVPERIDSSYPWFETINTNEIAKGTDRLFNGETTIGFQWESWWNGYTLFVFLRKPPKLSVIKSIIK